MNPLRKVFTSEIKTIDEREGTLTAYVSTNTRDRMNEVLDPQGIDVSNFRKNPVVLWAHDYTAPPIGKAIWIKRDGDGILSKVKFANTEFAQEIFQLYKEGFLKAFSVGFMPRETVDGDGEKEPRRTFKKWELLEYSAVPVPANPEALALAIQKGVLKTDSIKQGLEKALLEEDTWLCGEVEGTCDCKKVITKPEETDDYIRIPVRDCEITATITISEEEGIKGLYCGEVKKIATYLFAKAKGWTMDKAKEWVAEHDKEEEMISTGLEELQAENKLLNEKIIALEKENTELRFKLYEFLNTKQPSATPGITVDNLANKVVEVVNGVIRQAQGKVN